MSPTIRSVASAFASFGIAQCYQPFQIFCMAPSKTVRHVVGRLKITFLILSSWRMETIVEPSHPAHQEHVFFRVQITVSTMFQRCTIRLKTLGWRRVSLFWCSLSINRSFHISFNLLIALLDMFILLLIYTSQLSCVTDSSQTCGVKTGSVTLWSPEDALRGESGCSFLKRKGCKYLDVRWKSRSEQIRNKNWDLKRTREIGADTACVTNRQSPFQLQCFKNRNDDRASEFKVYVQRTHV